MNTIRTFSARNAFAAAAFILTGSLAAAPAFAQQVPRAEVRAAVAAAQGDGSLGSVAAQWGLDTNGRPLNASSTLSRAEVRAEARRANANGQIQASVGENSDAVSEARTGAVQTRAEVRAATLQAVREGRIDSSIGDSYGTTVVTRGARRTL